MSLKIMSTCQLNYSERFNKVVIARSIATWQSHEIASLPACWQAGSDLESYSLSHRRKYED